MRTASVPLMAASIRGSPFRPLQLRRCKSRSAPLASGFPSCSAPSISGLGMVALVPNTASLAQKGEQNSTDVRSKRATRIC